MTIRPQCFRCRHLITSLGTMSCPGFDPGEIPDAILLNEHDHRDPYEGDRGIRFEPRVTEDRRPMGNHNGREDKN